MKRFTLRGISETLILQEKIISIYKNELCFDITVGRAWIFRKQNYFI